MADRLVKVILRGDVAGFQASMASAAKSTVAAANTMTGASKEAAKFRAGLVTVGDTAGKIGLAAAGAFALVTKSAMDWESAFAGVKKTVDETANTSFADLEGQLRELARTMPATHEEIAAVAEAAGQLGVATDDVAEFSRVMLMLGETTNMTADEAATAIAQMTNIMGTAPDEVDNLASSLVAVGNAGASTERQIIQMSQGIAGAANVVGITEAEVLGIANAVASIGIEVEAGSTAISRVLTDMGKAAAQGGEDLALFAQAAGMSADEFATAFQQRPAEAFTAFIEGLGAVREAGGDVFTMLDELGLSDVRVSKALLGMSADAEKFAGSLQLATEEWSSGEAAAMEYAKRLDTASAQTEIAWNNIKDAAIGFGDAALPVVAGVADKVAGMAQAVGSLPGPVKAATSSMLGITAVLGGTAWFGAKTISGIASMRGALENLGMSGAKASGAMKKVGAAAAGLAALTIAAGAVRALQEATDEAVPGMQRLTGLLIDLGNGPEGISTYAAELDSLGESLRRITDRTGGESFTDALQTPFEGLFGEAGSLRQARAEVEAFDAAMANLANSGSPETAADAFDKLSTSLGLSKDEQEELLGIMPQYAEALARIENDAELAADASDEAGGAFAGMGDDAAGAADDITELVDAMKEQRSEALRAANAQINYQEALDDARASIKENGKNLDITTEKGRANRRALLDVAAAWNEQSAAAKNAPGAHRAAIASFVDLAGKMGMSEEKARALARRILELPDKKVRVEADTSQADSAIDNITYRLNGLDGRTARTYITTVFAEEGRNTLGGIQRASGGPVYGPGTSTSDSIPAWLSTGEFVMNARAVQKYGMGLMHDINAMRLRDGGPVGMASGGSIDDRIDILRLQQQINEMRRDLAADGKESLKGLARQITALELRAAQRDLRAARRAPLVEARGDLRETMRGLRGIELDVEGGAGVEDTREALREFRRAVRDAGGTWTNQMARMSQRMIEAAKASEKVSNRLERETEKRDELQSKLDEEIAALESLKQAMESFGQQVAGRFASDIFGGFAEGGGFAGGGGGGGGSASADAGRRSLLEAQLAAVRADSGMDPLERSHLASKLQSELDALGDVADAADGMSGAVEPAVDGLDALRQSLIDDTQRAREFAAALTDLSGALDADFFRELALSGNLMAAQGLAALDRSELAEVNELWEQRERAQAELAAFAAQEVFGRELDAATKAVQATEATLGAMDKTIGQLNDRLERLGQRVENGAERGVASLGKQLDGIRAEIAAIPRESRQGRRAGSGKGRS